MTVQRVASDDIASYVRDMKRDWDDRARRDAKWYINTLRAGQSDAEFNDSGKRETDNLVLADLDLVAPGRDPSTMSVLEIGCGAGRMTRFLAGIFGEVYATDVSAEMIRRAQARLRQSSNVRLAETNGTDFATFPSDRFDFILSAFVYQHVPSAAVISGNLEDAFRVLKPGGIFKFQTNGVVNRQYVSSSKDTWSGDTFPEMSIRALSRRIGAQLLGLWGAGTQYCWTVWRKPVRQGPARTGGRPCIVGHSGPATVRDKSTMPPGRYVSLLVSALDEETVDTISLQAVVHGNSVTPQYVGPPRLSLCKAMGRAGSWPCDQLRQVDFAIPTEVPAGSTSVSVRLESWEESEPYLIDIDEAGPELARIVLITNAGDGGLDIHDRGAKSRVRIFLDRPLPDAAEPVAVLGGRRQKAGPVSFVPGNNCYMIELSLPRGIGPGIVPVYIEAGDTRSAPWLMHVRRAGWAASSIMRQAKHAAAALLGR